MNRVKMWVAIAGIGVILGCGALFAFTRGAGRSNTPANAGLSRPAATKPMSPADVTQLVQGLISQAQQTASSNGPKKLTPAQAKAIVDEQLKKLGIAVPTK